MLSPKMLLPDEKITDDEIIFTFITSAVILPLTLRSFPTLNDPLISAEPDNDKLVFPTNPLFGDIANSAEPERIRLISPIASAGMLNNPLPSPLNNDDETGP